MKLSEYFKQAKNGGWAIGHFNFSTADVLRAIVQGAKDGRAPCVMVGTSPGEANFLGLPETVALVRAVSQSSRFPVFLNADHFSSFADCKAAIDIGYDSVHFDGHALPFDVNVTETRRVWEYAQKASGPYMMEGELGYLRGSSEIQKSVMISPADFTKPEQAADFVKRTGIERLAPVFGNIHGIVTEQEELLDLDRLIAIAKAVPDTYLVLHGASGLSDLQVKSAIAAGITNVHFNTELRVAYTTSIMDSLHTKSDEITPYKYLALAADKVKELVADKVRLFMSGAAKT
ncbi:MAG TPA: class II fructose-bisphosphate aldolase [Candidatus Paceibacterota bacterium]|nr:class II fructose-bisphosphate aldolase [Candidatus Paceibacterota bacterium]